MTSSGTGRPRVRHDMPGGFRAPASEGALACSAAHSVTGTATGPGTRPRRTAAGAHAWKGPARCIATRTGRGYGTTRTGQRFGQLGAKPIAIYATSEMAATGGASIALGGT